MAGRIPSEFVDELLARTDIVELINSRIPLRKAGKDFQACCPFHDEKTPSFTVSADKQFYHCFGCGAHGSAIGFLMEYEHQGFLEAVDELAKRAGMQVPAGAEAVRAGPDLRPLYELLEETASLYRHQLRQHSQANRAVDYLKGRGLTGEIAAAFGLGFAPPGWDFLLRTLGGSAPVRERLLQCGLVIEQEGKCYDRFRDRIMFPIRDRRGRVIGFGGRVLGEGGPKYLNSPETPVFHKGRELYGLHEAQRANHRLERLLVVEGYMDVIALAQFGITYAAATLGTAVTDVNLEQIFRFAPQTVFCFDGDRAGHDAAWKTLLTVRPRAGSRDIRFLFLPQGEDPDTLIRKEGAERFEELVRDSVPVDEYIYNNLTKNLDRNSLGAGDLLIEKAIPLLKSLPPNNLTKNLVLQLADKADISPLQLDVHNQLRGSKWRTWQPQSGTRRMTPVRLAIALLLQHPQLARRSSEVADDWRSLDRSGVGVLAELIDMIDCCPEIHSGALIERWRDNEAAPHVQKLADPFLLTNIPEDGRGEEFLGALMALNREAKDAEGELLFKRTSPSQLNEEEKRRLRGILSVAPHDET